MVHYPTAPRRSRAGLVTYDLRGPLADLGKRFAAQRRHGWSLRQSEFAGPPCDTVSRDWTARVGSTRPRPVQSPHNSPA